MVYQVLLALKATRDTTLAALLILVAVVGCVSPTPSAEAVRNMGQASASPSQTLAASLDPTLTLPLEPATTNTPRPTHSPTSEPTATAQPRPTFTPEPAMTDILSPSLVAEASPTPCVLSPIVVPTLPAKIPTYTQLDRATGLHVTGKPQGIDLSNYRLNVVGKVDHLLSLTYDHLRCMPKVEVHCQLVCPETFVDEATWAGVPMEYILELAGMQSGVEGIKLTSADGYSVPVPMIEVDVENNLLAYEWEGEPLPILHGFPVRAVFPESAGSRWVKWLVEIEVY